MKVPTMLALLLLLGGATKAVPQNSKAEHVGDLICTVGVASAKPGMLCVFRNKSTGLEETYQGSLANAGAASISPQRTLLWSVLAKPAIKLTPGILSQRYEAEESKPEKLKSIDGDDKPGVALSLITEKNEDLAALASLVVELHLVSAPT